MAGDLFETWLMPKDALAAVPADWGFETATRWITGRLANGLIQSAARWLILPNKPRRELVGVPREWWQNWPGLGRCDFWDTGDTAFYTGSGGGYGGGTLMGEAHEVRLDPTGFAQFSAVLPTAAKANRVGRPVKSFWEDLLIEMARQLHAGDLQPQRIADIEKAMHDWLIASGHEAGETAIRDRARKLFQAIDS